MIYSIKTIIFWVVQNNNNLLTVVAILSTFSCNVENHEMCVNCMSWDSGKRILRLK